MVSELPRNRTNIIAVLLLTLLAAGAESSYGQSSEATISGFISEESSGQPLQGANVLAFRGDPLVAGTATGAEGSYLIRGLPPGRYELQVSFIGYETSRDTTDLEADEVETITLQMTPSEGQMDEVVVEARNGAGAADITAGHQQIQPEDLARIPTPDVAGDLASHLSSQPGIVSTGDRGGQLFIRGGEPTQNLVYLDDIRLYQPFHILGFYSAFPSSIIRQTDVYAGGYGAMYGGALSSVIDVSSRHGHKRSYEGAVSISPFLSSLRAEGPILPGRILFLGSARRSTIDYGASRYMDEPLPFQFSDYFGKLHARTGEASRLSVTGIWTSDRGTLGQDVATRTPTGSDTLAAESAQIRWQNGGIGTRYLILPDVLPVRARLHLSRSFFEIEQGPAARPRRQSRVSHTRLGIDADFPGEHVPVEAGWTGDFIGLENDLGGRYQNVRSTGAGLKQVGIYVLPELRWNRLRLRPGARMQFYGVRFDPYVEPRFRAIFEPGAHQISLSAGMYQQELLGLYDRRDAANVFTAWTNIPREQDQLNHVRAGRISRAWHGILGYQADPTPWLQATIEGFYKRYTNLFISEWTAFPRFTTRLQPANGRSFGGEARVTMQWPDFYLYLNYGYSNAIYWARQSSLKLWYGQEALRFTPPHDRRHKVNLVVSATAWGFDLSLRWVFGSGRPFSKAVGFDGFTLIDDLEPLDQVIGSRRVIYEEPYGARLPPYHRLDISIERAFRLGGASLTVQGSLINTYDRPNIFYLDVFTLRRADQLPLVPSLGLKVSFP